MRSVSDPNEIQHYRQLADAMMLVEANEGCEFDPEWVRNRGWKVVPAEQTGGHFSVDDISRLVSVLNEAGHHECVVVATEPVGDLSSCYLLSITEPDLHQFNLKLGPFRFLLTDANRSWAISCTEWYNLFASSPKFLEALLGKPIEQARQDYLSFLSELSTSPDEPLFKIAALYASL